MLDTSSLSPASRFYARRALRDALVTCVIQSRPGYWMTSSLAESLAASSAEDASAILHDLGGMAGAW